jgi:excisionase family DNA binding protein
MIIEPLNVAIPEAARLLGIGRSTAYELLGAGKLKSVKIGSRRLVTVASVRAFADSLATEGA